MPFDQQYYEAIWGTIHRHDYVVDLAKRLVREYGIGAYLDIGTGCGALVRELRVLGCDAFGLEISLHAIAHSCAAAYVRHGDVRAIPFPPERFDVIHSQGLWEYVPEADVAQAWRECLRVGRAQVHNFDAAEQDNFPEHRKITVKPRVWWKERMRV